MQQASSTAERVVAVLSPDYLQSKHAEAEWGVFYAEDPRGDKGLLLPVRVRDVEPPGLLKTRVYVDLVSRDALTARTALMAAVRGARGKPQDEPEFPGDLEDRASGTVVPLFPGRADTGLPEQMAVTIRADELGALRSFIAEVVAALTRDGFSEFDTEAFRIALRELVDNVAKHVGQEKAVRLELEHVHRSPYTYQEGLYLEVRDGGEGFEFNETLRRLETELQTESGREHGLLRAYRLGSSIEQVSRSPHVIGWMRERVPKVVPMVFEHEDVVPFVFSYRQEAVLVWQNVHTFLQFEHYLQRSEAFTDLIFDPLLRPARTFVGIEITGQGWTGVVAWRKVLDRLLAFSRKPSWQGRELILFADTGPWEQSDVRRYCRQNGISMFEDPVAVRAFLSSSRRRSQRRP
jgi:anti-sigma regulatory factor (Ser/Thr protein kinase)